MSIFVVILCATVYKNKKYILVMYCKKRQSAINAEVILQSNFAFQNGRPQHNRPTEFPMHTNGDVQIRGVGIHAVGPLVVFLAQWMSSFFI